jgi:transcriptional regulator with XRE-family HTH domain
MESKPAKNFLRKIREQRGLTQEQLAEISGVTRYLISDFENEKRLPSPRTISRLSEALECSYIALMTGKEDSDKDTRKNLIENRQKYLDAAVSLTKKYYGEKGFDEELLMKISGQLSYIIGEYESASSQERERILKEIKDQRPKLLAEEIFLNTKIINPI